jgi:hypothetical protein
VTTITTGAASETYTSPGDRNFPGPTKPTTARTISAAIKTVFKNAVKAVTCRAEDAPPPKSRRRGETEKGFIRAVKRRRHDYDGLRETHRAVARRATSKAFGKAAKEALLDAPIREDFAGGGGYGGDLFDPASAYWHGNNANNDQWQNEDFSAKQDQYFPQP